MTDPGTDAGSMSQSQSETQEGSGEESSTGFVEPGCGNGVVEGDEECDEGDMNSNTEPDACREDCKAAACRDMVVDSGEECDNGLMNSDFDENACRYECMLPSCGDNVTDEGERCDDDNDAFGDGCFRCSDRWYFILNGNGAIIRTTRDGPAEQIVGATAGLHALAALPAASQLCAVQSMGGMDRVLCFDPATGEMTKDIDIGMGAVGYDPDARRIVLGSDGMLHVAASGGGAVHIISIDPASDAVEDASLGSSFTIADMTADEMGSLYISTGGGGGIERVDLATMTPSNFAGGLGNPSGINYQAQNQLVWTISQTGGGPVTVTNLSLAGAPSTYTTSKTGVGSETPALLIDVGDVIAVPAPEQNRIAAIALLGGVSDLFTDMTMSPIDIEQVVLDGSG